MIVLSIQILSCRSRLQRSHDCILAFTQGVALGYDSSRLQRYGIEWMLATQGPRAMIGRAFNATGLDDQKFAFPYTVVLR
jgi:hypothetical protein